jgi:hypothetical protein
MKSENFILIFTNSSNIIKKLIFFDKKKNETKKNKNYREIPK